MSVRNAGNLQNSLFQLKFTAKSLSRQAKKSQKDAEREKTKVKKALAEGNIDAARIYAQNNIRKKNEHLNLVKLASRVEAVASRIQTAIAMRSVARDMRTVVGGIDKAMESMNLEQITKVMEKFEEQFSDIDVQTEIMSSATADSAPQDDVDFLLKQMAEEAAIEIKHEMGSNNLDSVSDLPSRETREEEGQLVERLRALRPAT